MAGKGPSGFGWQTWIVRRKDTGEEMTMRLEGHRLGAIYRAARVWGISYRLLVARQVCSECGAVVPPNVSPRRDCVRR